jgi:hypothetical protein
MNGGARERRNADLRVQLPKRVPDSMMGGAPERAILDESFQGSMGDTPR